MEPEVLVLGPGGMKVFLELGALMRLHRFLARVHTYVGCSIGSLVALLLVAGYRPEDIFNDLLGESVLEHLRMTREFGQSLVNPDAVRTKLAKRLAAKFGIVPNLEQLYFFTGLEFVSVVYNLKRERVEYFSKDTEPMMSSVEAVIASMSIPGIFPMYKYKGGCYIDGAFGNPYPVDVKDDGQTRVLGVSIEEQMSSEKEYEGVQLLFKLVHAPMNELKKRIMESASQLCDHLVLRSEWVDTFGVALAEHDKVRMAVEGYACAEKYLQAREVTSLCVRASRKSSDDRL